MADWGPFLAAPILMVFGMPGTFDHISLCVKAHMYNSHVDRDMPLLHAKWRDDKDFLTSLNLKLEQRKKC